jgi:nucleoside-diphosphate-sugar epimerase
MSILVTGSTGFVGTALIKQLIKDQFSVSATVRNSSTIKFNSNVNVIDIGHLTSSLDWSSALQGVNTIIHLAARAHFLNDKSRNPLFDYRYINVDCSLNLARQAAKAGVKRFIYVSSIKVNGEFTILGKAFTAEDVPMPQDFYGISKFEAELGLRLIAEEFGMDLIIIRPPLVYGPGVQGNFLLMMNWLRRDIPLPLGGVKKNRRSFVFIDNLVSMIIVCINHPGAANQTFLVSDDEDLSTVGLLDRMALLLGYPSKLIVVPTALIMLGTKLIGRPDVYQRLCCSLQVDIKKTKDLLGWEPSVSVDEGLRQTAAHFLNVSS